MSANPADMAHAKFWRPLPIWEGETVFIIGGGPSLRGVDLESQLKGRRVIGVNYAGLIMGPWVDVCFFGDCRWFDWEMERLQKLTALRVTCCERLHLVPWLRVMKRSRKRPCGIEPNSKQISWNWSSGGAAINLAYHFGARRIILVGFDLQKDSARKTHWHDEYYRVNPGQEEVEYTYKRFRKGFDQIAVDARGLGVEIINATPGSSLTSFPICSLAEVL